MAGTGSGWLSSCQVCSVSKLGELGGELGGAGLWWPSQVTFRQAGEGLKEVWREGGRSGKGQGGDLGWKRPAKSEATSRGLRVPGSRAKEGRW